MAASKKTAESIKVIIKGLERRADGQNKVGHSYDKQVDDLLAEFNSLTAKQDVHFAEERSLREQVTELSTLV